MHHCCFFLFPLVDLYCFNKILHVSKYIWDLTMRSYCFHNMRWDQCSTPGSDLRLMVRCQSLTTGPPMLCCHLILSWDPSMIALNFAWCHFFYYSLQRNWCSHENALLFVKLFYRFKISCFCVCVSFFIFILCYLCKYAYCMLK